MPRWEYRRIDIATTPRRGDDIDLLDDAGSNGWELVGITVNGTAYLKRELDPPVATVHRRAGGGHSSGGQGAADPRSGPSRRE